MGEVGLVGIYLNRYTYGHILPMFALVIFRCVCVLTKWKWIAATTQLKWPKLIAIKVPAAGKRGNPIRF